MGLNKMYTCRDNAKQPFGVLDERFDRENSHYFVRVCDWGPCSTRKIFNVRVDFCFNHTVVILSLPNNYRHVQPNVEFLNTEMVIINSILG